MHLTQIRSSLDSIHEIITLTFQITGFSKMTTYEKKPSKTDQTVRARHNFEPMGEARAQKQ